MNHIRKTLLAAAAASLLLLAGCSSGDSGDSTEGANNADAELNSLLPQAIKDKGKLVIATDAQYPPCESMDGDKMVGFEPDLWNAMAEKLGIKVEVVNTGFDGLIPGVAAGRYDIAMECIDDTPEREKQVSFVNYVYSVDAVMFRTEDKGKINEDALSLCGLTASVPRGTTFVDQVRDVMSPHCVDNGKPAIEVNEFPSSNAALLAVYSGRADFQIVNLASGRYIAETAPEPVTVIKTDKSAKYYSGIVIGKDNTQLQKAMLAALEAIIEDGQYDKIMAKWDLSEMSIEKPGINLATSDPLPDQQ